MTSQKRCQIRRCALQYQREQFHPLKTWIGFSRNGTNKFNSASPRVSRWPSSVACRFHQTGATPICWYIHVSPNLVLFTGSTRGSSSRRGSLGPRVCLVGKYACWMGGSCIRCQALSHASISTTLIALSCLLTSELRWRRLAKRIAQLYPQMPSDFMACSLSP